MSSHVPGPPLARGRTAEVYHWQEGQVLKLFYDWCGAQCAPREFETTRAVSAAGLPTPRPVGTVQIDGRPGIIFERVDGPSMLTVINHKPWLAVGLARQLADLQAAIHTHAGDGLPALCPALRALINLWRGLFHRAYLARTLARHPGLTRAELGTWLIPVAAARLNERIAGEEARLLSMIRSGLAPHQPS